MFRSSLFPIRWVAVSGCPFDRMNLEPVDACRACYSGGERGDDWLVAGVVGQRVLDASLKIDVDEHGGAGGDCLHRAVELRGRGSLSLALLEEAGPVREAGLEPSCCTPLSRRLRSRAWQSRSSWLHAQRLLTIALPPQAGRPRRMSGWIFSSRSTIRSRAGDAHWFSLGGDVSRSEQGVARWRCGWPSRSVRPARWSRPTSTPATCRGSSARISR